MLIKKESSLEIQSQDTKETLNWKLEQLSSKNLPIEQGMADYIYFGVSNIDAKIRQLKSYSEDIKLEMKKLELYKSTVSEEIAEWMQEQGTDKLSGIECSSITINKGSAELEEKIKTKVFVLDCTNEFMETYLINSGFAHYEEKEETKIKVATKDKIRINSKRK